MRRQVLASIVTLPLLIALAQAGQVTWGVNSWQPYGIPSEDSGSASYLGVDIADVSADRVAALKLKEEKGVEVTMVDQDAPAGKAGIKEHDVIQSMNGTEVDSKSQLQRMIHETPPGRTVTLVLSRDGQPVTVKVQLADRRSEFHVAKDKDDGDFHFEMPPIPNIDVDIPNFAVVVVQSSARSGLMVENLTPQLAEFFGAKDGKGVLVRSVEKGSRADKAGLRAGDVIVRVGDQAVHDTSDFTHVFHARSAGSVNVEVIRDRKAQSITIMLPGRRESGKTLQESFDLPEMDAQRRMELSEMQEQVARLGPQMELAEQEVRKSSEEMRKTMCEKSKEMKEQALKMRQQYREELRKSEGQMRKQMEQLRREMPHWLDI